MLHNKMTTEQILEEIRKDSFLLLSKSLSFYNVFSRNRNNMAQTFNYTSSRNNIYQVIYLRRDYGIVFYVVTKIPTDYGNKWVLVLLDCKQSKLEGIKIINPHVIDRIQERWQIDSDVNIISQMIMELNNAPTFFLNENKELMPRHDVFVPHQKYGIVAHIGTGLIFGEFFTCGTNLEKTIIAEEIKTYLPTHMLNKRQREIESILSEEKQVRKQMENIFNLWKYKSNTI